MFVPCSWHVLAMLLPCSCHALAKFLFFLAFHQYHATKHPHSCSFTYPAIAHKCNCNNVEDKSVIIASSWTEELNKVCALTR
jgi:hypothetical protein